MFDRTFENKLKEFSHHSSRKYRSLDGIPSYSHACGYLESMCASMFQSLSKKDQQHFLKLIAGSIKNVQDEGSL